MTGLCSAHLFSHITTVGIIPKAYTVIPIKGKKKIQRSGKYSECLLLNTSICIQMIAFYQLLTWQYRNSIFNVVRYNPKKPQNQADCNF